MILTFYIAAAVAVFSTAMVIGHLNAVHALLYLIVSLLAVALSFFTLGAPFVAALEVIIYAGAIMVLFLFVIMTLNLGPHAREQEREMLAPSTWLGPTLLAGILMLQLVYVMSTAGGSVAERTSIGPKAVATALFGPYVIGVELASILLMSGLVGAYHLGRQRRGRKAEGEII